MSKIATLNAKRYIPTGGGFTGAEVVALHRILEEHGNPHKIPAIDTLGEKVATLRRWSIEDREEAYR